LARIALLALPQGIKRVCPGTIEADAARDFSPFPPQLTSHNITEAAPHLKWCGLLPDQEPSPKLRSTAWPSGKSRLSLRRLR
jgi:hypothetical protein